jgi:hypothetical protein
MNKLLLSLICSYLICTATITVQAQHQITGTVKDRIDGSSIPYSTAALLRSDSSAISGVMVNDSGKFVIPNVVAGNYLLQVSFVGYEKEYRTVSVPSQSDLGEILLSTSENQLQEVVVSVSSRVIQKSDRIVFQVTNENLTKGRSSQELLKFTPMLRIGQSDMIEIVGKDGFVLYVNSRKTPMNPSEIHAYLSTLPADRIESIEVITDPGVTMRTGGNTGVINLILKKNEANGINGSLTVQDRQGRLNSQDGGLYLNYQKDRLNVSANVSVDASNVKNYDTSDFYYTESNFHQNLENNTKSMARSLNGIIRVDYKLSDNHVFGFAYSISYFNIHSKRNVITQFGRMREMAIDSILQSESSAKSPTENHSFNLNYRFKTSERGNLAIDVYYLRNDRKQTIDNNTWHLYEIAPFERYRQRSDEPMSNYSGKMEYTHVFSPGNNLTFGTDIYRITAVSDFFYGNWNDDGIYESDPQKTNEFSFRESYAGAYISYSRVWNEKFNSRIGLIGEYIDSKGVQHVTSEEIVRNSFDISPSLSLQYQFNPAHRISYNLTSYVRRPGFYSMNPFRFWLSPTTYKEYNPNLKPSRLIFNTLNYTIKGHYSFVLGYNYIDQCTNNFLVPVDGQYTKYINANYGTLQSANVTFNWNESLWKNRVSVNAGLSGDYIKSKGAVETIIVDTENLSWDIYVSSNVKLSQRYDWNLTGGFSYYSKMKLAHENVSDSYRFSIGMKKNFVNNISLSFGIQRLFYKLASRDKASDSYKYYTSHNLDMRQAYIGVTIPFGNMKAKGASNRNISSSKVGGRLREN